jgi:hypothetical protein
MEESDGLMESRLLQLVDIDDQTDGSMCKELMAYIVACENVGDVRICFV